MEKMVELWSHMSPEHKALYYEDNPQQSERAYTSPEIRHHSASPCYRNDTRRELEARLDQQSDTWSGHKPEGLNEQRRDRRIDQRQDARLGYVHEALAKHSHETVADQRHESWTGHQQEDFGYHIDENRTEHRREATTDDIQEALNDQRRAILNYQRQETRDDLRQEVQANRRTIVPDHGKEAMADQRCNAETTKAPIEKFGGYVPPFRVFCTARKMKKRVEKKKHKNAQIIKDYMKITRDDTPKPYLQGGSTVVSRPQEFKTRFHTPSPFLDTRYNANDEESKNKSTYIGTNAGSTNFPRSVNLVSSSADIGSIAIHGNSTRNMRILQHPHTKAISHTRASHENMDDECQAAVASISGEFNHMQEDDEENAFLQLNVDHCEKTNTDQPYQSRDLDKAIVSRHITTDNSSGYCPSNYADDARGVSRFDLPVNSNLNTFSGYQSGQIELNISRHNENNKNVRVEKLFHNTEQCMNENDRPATSINSNSNSDVHETTTDPTHARLDTSTVQDGAEAVNNEVVDDDDAKYVLIPCDVNIAKMLGWPVHLLPKVSKEVLDSFKTEIKPYSNGDLFPVGNVLPECIGQMSPDSNTRHELYDPSNTNTRAETDGLDNVTMRTESSQPDICYTDTVSYSGDASRIADGVDSNVIMSQQERKDAVDLHQYSTDDSTVLDLSCKKSTTNNDIYN